MTIGDPGSICKHNENRINCTDCAAEREAARQKREEEEQNNQK